MPKRSKPTTASATDKQRRLRETRERLEQLGVAEDTVPDPVSGEAGAGGRGEAEPADGPDQASVQPAAAGLKDVLDRQRKA